MTDCDQTAVKTKHKIQIQNVHVTSSDIGCCDGVTVRHLASIEALEEDHSHRPDIHLVGDLRWFLPHHKALWRKVPKYKIKQTDLIGYQIRDT